MLNNSVLWWSTGGKHSTRTGQQGWWLRVGTTFLHPRPPPKKCYFHTKHCIHNMQVLQADKLIHRTSFRLSTLGLRVGRHPDPSPSPWRRAVKCRMSDVAFTVRECRSKRISKSCQIRISRRGSGDETHEDSKEHRWPEAEPGRDYVQSTGDTDQPQVSTNKPHYWCKRLINLMLTVWNKMFFKLLKSPWAL